MRCSTRSSLSGDDRIVELEVLNPYVDKEHLLEKGVILDVKARDGLRRLYNIEVQVAQEPAYVERALYYLTRLFGSQLKTGDAYTQLARTIGISLVDFVLFDDLEGLHSRYRLHDASCGRELTDVLELHFIELAKLRRRVPQELGTPFEKWVHVLKYGELYGEAQEPVPETLAQEEGIEMALEKMRRASASEEVRELVEMRLKASHDQATRLEWAEKKGLEKGFEKGLEKGLAKGRQQGLLEAARRMRQAGMTMEQISEMTGLPPDDLEE